jgi:hypothetical protein
LPLFAFAVDVLPDEIVVVLVVEDVIVVVVFDFQTSVHFVRQEVQEVVNVDDMKRNHFLLNLMLVLRFPFVLAFNFGIGTCGQFVNATKPQSQISEDKLAINLHGLSYADISRWKFEKKISLQLPYICRRQLRELGISGNAWDSHNCLVNSGIPTIAWAFPEMPDSLY